MVIFTIITISNPAEPGNCKTKYKHNIFRGDQSIESFCGMQFNVLSWDLKTDEDCWATDMQDLASYSSLTAFFSLTGPTNLSLSRSSHGFMHMRIQLTSSSQYILGQFSRPFNTIAEMVNYYTVSGMTSSTSTKSFYCR